MHHSKCKKRFRLWNFWSRLKTPGPHCAEAIVLKNSGQTGGWATLHTGTITITKGIATDLFELGAIEEFYFHEG